MKALRITAHADGIQVRPLPLPSAYRKGDVPAEFYRRQASGEAPKAELNLSPAAFLRTIIVPDGKFTKLASAPGALLTFVICGELSLATGAGQATNLISGDVFLVDADSASRIVPTARGNCRLVQLGAAADWPGPDAKPQSPGTLIPRRGNEPNIKHLYQGKDDRTYFSEFPELFPAPTNEWSAPRVTPAGFRFMCWEDGFIDWHPEVINNLAIFLSGELELESGGDRAIETFRAGDVCLASDRTGEGHIDRTRGATHVALIVIETENLW